MSKIDGAGFVYYTTATLFIASVAVTSTLDDRLIWAEMRQSRQAEIDERKKYVFSLVRGVGKDPCGSQKSRFRRFYGLDFCDRVCPG